jgi:hypothetical protein
MAKDIAKEYIQARDGERMTCTCGEVRVGNETVGKNWSEYCDEHGINSAWFFDKERHHLHKWVDGLPTKGSTAKPCKVCGLK